MRIVYCIPALYNSGGMERVLSLKVNDLVAKDYDIHIVTTDQAGRPLFFELDKRVKVYDLGINHEENNGGPLWKKLRDFPIKRYKHRKRLRRLLCQLKADIVVSMFGEEVFFLPSIQDGSIKVLEYHFSRLKRLQYNRTGLWALVDRWRTKKDGDAVMAFDRFVVLTEEDRELWRKLPNMCVIPNPLPFESLELADVSIKRVIAAGRYDYQKNFEALIDIWSRVAPDFPDWRLDIYGDGGLREALQERVDRLGLRHSLTLQRPTKQIAQEYLSSSVYAMTSRYEGLPMVLLEAQSVGLPIISYTCKCGPRDIITDSVDGFLVEEGDADMFASKLRLLMSDVALRTRMSNAGHKASARYRLSDIMGQWEQLFEEVLAEK